MFENVTHVWCGGASLQTKVTEEKRSANAVTFYFIGEIFLFIYLFIFFKV